MAIELRSATTKTTNTVKSKTQNVSTNDEVNTSDSSVQPEADFINLTSSAFNIQQAEESLASVPIVNASHVAEVAEALDNGNYEINNERITEKIIALEQELYE